MSSSLLPTGKGRHNPTLLRGGNSRSKAGADGGSAEWVSRPTAPPVSTAPRPQTSSGGTMRRHPGPSGLGACTASSLNSSAARITSKTAVIRGIPSSTTPSTTPITSTTSTGASYKDSNEMQAALSSIASRSSHRRDVVDSFLCGFLSKPQQQQQQQQPGRASTSDEQHVNCLNLDDGPSAAAALAFIERRSCRLTSSSQLVGAQPSDVGSSAVPASSSAAAPHLSRRSSDHVMPSKSEAQALDSRNVVGGGNDGCNMKPLARAVAADTTLSMGKTTTAQTNSEGAVVRSANDLAINPQQQFPRLSASQARAELPAEAKNPKVSAMASAAKCSEMSSPPPLVGKGSMEKRNSGEYVHHRPSFGHYACRHCLLPLFTANSKVVTGGGGYAAFSRQFVPSLVASVVLGTAPDPSEPRIFMCCVKCKNFIGVLSQRNPMGAGDFMQANSRSIVYVAKNAPEEFLSLEKEYVSLAEEMLADHGSGRGSTSVAGRLRPHAALSATANVNVQCRSAAHHVVADSSGSDSESDDEGNEAADDDLLFAETRQRYKALSGIQH